VENIRVQVERHIDKNVKQEYRRLICKGVGITPYAYLGFCKRVRDVLSVESPNHARERYSVNSEVRKDVCKFRLKALGMKPRYL
jgi:hypothetical protein